MFYNVRGEKSGQEVTCETGNEIIKDLIGCLSKYQLTVELGLHMLQEATEELEKISSKKMIEKNDLVNMF